MCVQIRKIINSWFQLITTISGSNLKFRHRLNVFAHVILLMVVTMTNPTFSAESHKPKLNTNQTWLEDLNKSKSIEIDNVDDAFSFVFSNLPDEVLVYPTENYYYFTFTSNGVVYAGNLRLAAQDRDDGIIHFAVFKQANQASESGEMLYKPLMAKDGVTVEKKNPFSYSVTHKNKSVLFKLNDVSEVKPSEKIVAAGEKYLGLVVDESGLQFFLFYNERHKLFVYVLNETTKVLDVFTKTDDVDRMLVGHRTGFVLYDHHHLNRRVLIGVHGRNTVVNNYYDGPADQLPENHIVDDNLRKSIVDSDPSVAGELDKFGYFKTGEGRYLIAPYLQYLSLNELLGYDECANDPSIDKTIYDACFFAGDQ